MALFESLTRSTTRTFSCYLLIARLLAVRLDSGQLVLRLPAAAAAVEYAQCQHCMAWGA